VIFHSYVNVYQRVKGTNVLLMRQSVDIKQQHWSSYQHLPTIRITGSSDDVGQDIIRICTTSLLLAVLEPDCHSDVPISTSQVIILFGCEGPLARSAMLLQFTWTNLLPKYGMSEQCFFLVFRKLINFSLGKL